MQLFHNSNVLGSCIIRILYTVCAKIKKKNNSGAKRLRSRSRVKTDLFMRVLTFEHSGVTADSVLPGHEAASIPNERNHDIFLCIYVMDY